MNRLFEGPELLSISKITGKKQYESDTQMDGYTFFSEHNPLFFEMIDYSETGMGRQPETRLEGNWYYISYPKV